MKYRVAGIIAVAVMFIVGFVGIAVASGPDIYHRYHQHEEARSLEDLSPEEREAASSLDTDPDAFATHLPIISIQTDGQTIPGRPAIEGESYVYDEYGKRLKTVAEDGSETIPVELELFDNSEETPSVANRLSDSPVFETQAEMRIRGNSSSSLDKASYRITFTTEDRVTPNPQEVLGMGVEQDWVLHGPFLDRSLLRNYIAYNVFGEITKYSPDVRFVELYIDDRYYGVYLLVETIKYGPDRVSLEKSDPNQSQTSFIVKRDWDHMFGSEQVDDFLQDIYESTNTGVGVEYPNQANLTEAQKEWIIDEMYQIEKNLYSYDYDEPIYGLREILDYDSFIDYALVNEYALNLDSTEGSTFYYRDLGDRLAIGPIWDFNNGFGTETPLENINDAGFFTTDRPYYAMLYRDEYFTDRLINRWKELRETVLSDERMQQYVDDAAAFLGPAAERNNSVWGFAFDPDYDYDLGGTEFEGIDAGKNFAPYNPADYQEELEFLKDVLKERGAWMDEHIDTFNHYSHESLVKKYNH